jgi:hypothetical protein
MTEIDDYCYYAIWSEDDNQYVGLCDEFPSLCWLEPFIEDAIKGIRRCVAEMLADLKNQLAASKKESLPL